MTKRFSSARRRLALAGALVLAACGDSTSTPPTQLNLDGPVDIAFACYGGLRITGGGEGTPTQPIEVTAQPTSACDIRSQLRAPADPVPLPFGQQDLTAQGGAFIPVVNWHGLILQQGPGTVAIARFAASGARTEGISVIDADPLTPGNNSISVGEDPIAIATMREGCHAVTANAGSCDLSVIDVTSALEVSDPSVKIDRLAVTTASGQPLRSRPAAMVTEPSIDLIGNTCPARPSGLIYIAYPSCHLVAAVDAASGRMVAGVQYDALGVPTIVGGNVSCPDECGGVGTITPGVRPVALDLERDARTGNKRLVIGADNSPSLSIVELDDTTLLPSSVFRIALENTTGSLGVISVALSPEIGMGGVSGTIDDDGAVGGESQFVYAVATDGSVRVADVLNVRRECDTQIDPRFIRAIRQVGNVSCLPIGDPTLPRRVGANGPGIRATGIPLSVDIFRSPPVVGQMGQSPGRLVGTFAVVAMSSGQTAVVNIDDDNYPDLFDPTRPLAVPVTSALPHQLRDAVGNRGELADLSTLTCEYSGPLTNDGAALGNPRASTPPVRNVPAGAFASEKLTQLPGLRQLTCTGGLDAVTRAISEVSFTAPEAVRDQVFPDVAAIPVDETWTLTWEGSLSNDAVDNAVDGPVVRESTATVDPFGLHLFDQTRPYCQAGVEPFDIVQMRGCNPSLGDAECPTGYRCFVHPDSEIQGLGSCMLANEAERLATACRDFLLTVRRYTVQLAKSGELLLVPRRHQLRTTPLTGCVDNAQCESLADYALKNQSSQHPLFDTTAADPRTYTCEPDPTRPPIATGKRCMLRCETSADCIVGTVCQGATAGQPASGYCMESVTPPQACVNAPQRYELRAGNAFAVVGTRTGFLQSNIEGPNGQCVRPPTTNPLAVSRIPLTPPACDPTADPITGRRPNGTFEPNPCSTTIPHVDVVPNYAADCSVGSPATSLVERMAPAIRFRNPAMTIHIVDPYYPGDQTCITDRRGTLGQVPVVFPGYQLSFRLIGGLRPLNVAMGPTFPVKVVRGPANTIWVLDEGDFLATTPGQPSTRGQVYRIEPSAIIPTIVR